MKNLLSVAMCWGIASLVGCGGGGSVSVESTPILDKMGVSIGECKFEAGTAKCIASNASQRRINLFPLGYETYDKAGVKVGSGKMTEVLNPGGKTLVEFPQGGPAVRRVVIVDEFARSLGQ